MSKINLHNYEAWFLDYFEGNLNEAKIAELNSFLDENPELKAEFEGDFENLNLEADSVNISFKEDLKKHSLVNHKNVDDFMIAENEGLLDKKAKLELGAFVAANNLYEDRKLYSLVYLAKTNAIRYPNAEQLKKLPFVNHENVDDFMIAENEGLLNQNEKKELNAFVAKNNLEKDRKLFSLVYLAKTNAIRFPNKEKLKKGGALIPLFVRYAAAAAIAFLIAFALFYNNQNYSETPKIAVDTPIDDRNIKTQPSNKFPETKLVVEGETKDPQPTPNSRFVENNSPVVLARAGKNAEDRKSVNKKDKKQYRVKTLDAHVNALAMHNSFSPNVLQPVAIEPYNTFENDNAKKAGKYQPKTYTIWEYAGIKIKEKILGQDNVEDGRIRENDLVKALASSVNKLSNKDVVAFEDNSSHNAVNYDFKIGKLDFNRSKTK